MKYTHLELLEFLSHKQGYMLIGSFAISLWTPFSHSDDVDIVIKDEKIGKEWASDLINKGWIQLKSTFSDIVEEKQMITLEKEGTTFDIIYQPKEFEKYASAEARVEDLTVFTLSPEAQFIRKLRGAFLHPERREKRLWDLEGAIALGKIIDSKKVQEIFRKVCMGSEINY